ncbi:MAG: hypothetical protein Q9182_004617 [Xanthomendoza sp. 2 TL-2023]
MEALAAFSLAAGVIQVVDFSTRVLKHCRELHEDGSLAKHRDSAEVANELASQAGTPMSQDISDLIDISAKCSSNAEDLLAEFSKLKIHPGGLRKAIKTHFQAMERKQWLKEKQEELERFEKVLNTRILVRLNTQSLNDAHHLEDLEENVKRLALGLANDCNTVETLLQAQNQQLISHVDYKLDDQERKRAERQRQYLFLKSLYFPEIYSREEQISDAFEGTCKWIFDSEDRSDDDSQDDSEVVTGRWNSYSWDHNVQNRPWANFRTWLKKGTGAYWISGKPGAGKSTLMKYIFEEKRTEELLEAWKGQNELLLIRFFFWNTGSDLQKSSAGLLRSLVYQIATQWPAMIELVTSEINRQNGQSNLSENLNTLAAWTDRRLLSFLELMLDRRPESAYLCVFIDGLDEFVGDEDVLLDIIRLFVSRPRLKVCVSSRPEQAFRQEFRLCCQIRVQDLNRGDFAAIIQRKLIPTISQWMNPEYGKVQELQYLLMKKAEGVWLWLDLMIKDLIKGARDGDTFEELYERLKRTPNTIKGIYAQKLQSIDPSYLEEAIGYFHVLNVHSTTQCPFPVTILLLNLAEEEWWSSIVDLNACCFESAAFDSSCRRLEKRLLSRCAGLVEVQDVDEEEKSVVLRHDRNLDFIHRTVEEFLHEEHAAFFQKPSGYSKAIIKLARGCLGSAYLKRDNESEFCAAIRDTMTVLRTLGYSPTKHNFEDELGFVQVDLVNQVIKTVDHYYAAQHKGRSFHNKWKFIMQLMHIDLLNSLPTDPRTVDLSLAASYGCKEFVELQLSKFARFEESLVNFVLLGYIPRVGLKERSLSIPDLAAYHLILRNLSDRGFDPNQLVPGLSPKQTRWNLFFSNAMLEVCSAHLRYRSSRQEQSFLAETCIEAVDRFLSLGADRKSVFQVKCRVRLNNVRIKFFLEESALSIFDRLPTEIAHRLRGVKELLLSARVERHRQFLDINVFPDRPSGHRLYRISSARAQQLTDSMYPDLDGGAEPAWLKVGDDGREPVANPFVKRFLNDFIENLSEEDRIL